MYLHDAGSACSLVLQVVAGSSVGPLLPSSSDVGTELSQAIGQQLAPRAGSSAAQASGSLDPPSSALEDQVKPVTTVGLKSNLRSVNTRSAVSGATSTTGECEHVQSSHKGSRKLCGQGSLHTGQDGRRAVEERQGSSTSAGKDDQTNGSSVNSQGNLSVSSQVDKGAPIAATSSVASKSF